MLTTLVAVGGTISFTGPEDVNGNPCVAGPGCIVGDPKIYEVFSASITMGAVGMYTLNIQTNYGVTLPGNGANPIPLYNYLQTSAAFGFGDFLIQTPQGDDYAIVLEPHDGYTQGNLYKLTQPVNGFLTSQQVLSAGGIPNDQIPRPNLPVELAPGGSLVGTGKLTVTANAGSNGVSSALYSISDTFSAPADFLAPTIAGKYTVFVSSYACANGFLEGTTGGFTGGVGGGTPEPSSWLMMLSGLVVLGVARYRKIRA